jgi:hypothetical protein
LHPDQATGALTSVPGVAPDWLEGTVLDGVRALGRTWTVKVENGEIAVHER